MTQRNATTRRSLLRRVGRGLAGGGLLALGGVVAAGHLLARPGRRSAAPADPAKADAYARLAACINDHQCARCTIGRKCDLPQARSWRAGQGSQ